MSPFRLFLLVLTLALSSTLLYARDNVGNTDRTQWGHDIRVAAGENVTDLTCFFCSIYVRGNTAGDVTAIGGRIEVEGPAQVAGDVTAIMGNVSITSGAKIAGDLTAVGGNVQRGDSVEVSGDVTSIRRGWWLTLLLVSPLVMLGVLIAAIVWLIGYLRRPHEMPARA